MTVKQGLSFSVLVSALVLIMPPTLFSQGKPFEPNLADVATAQDVKVANRAVSVSDKAGKPALRFDERAGDGLAVWPDVEFSDGIIEFDVRGKDVFQQSFVGVAFHGVGEAYEAVYFRPFNFRTGDPSRQSHALQYVSQPTYTWDKLRNAPTRKRFAVAVSFTKCCRAPSTQATRTRLS